MAKNGMIFALYRPEKAEIDHYNNKIFIVLGMILPFHSIVTLI